MKTATYPSRVGETLMGHGLGRGLMAEETIEEGTVVERLEGRAVPYSRIPDSEIRIAFELNDDRWMVPQSSARHINHSCDANCYIADNLDVLTSRKVYRGEELTLMYNEVTLEQYMKSGSVLPVWDDRRSFDCFCGAPKCIGRIDRYVVPVPADPKYDWQGFLSQDRMPHVINPKQGFLANWNNKPAAWWPNYDAPIWGRIFRNEAPECWVVVSGAVVREIRFGLELAKGPDAPDFPNVWHSAVLTRRATSHALHSASQARSDSSAATHADRRARRRRALRF